MKVLVLGAQGMLGSGLVQRLALRHEVHATVRDAPIRPFPDSVTVHAGVDVRDEPLLVRILDGAKPELVINAVGIVKQHADSTPTETFVAVNSLFPHRLARLTGERGAHLIHISTDCVFSGRRGLYSEADLPDPVDIYGLSKLLGEPETATTSVIRCSMIGLEDKRPGRRSHGLVEWFLGQTGEVSGFSRSIFSGLTVRQLSLVIEDVGMRGGLPGLWHVAADPISKFDLLRGLAERLPERGLTVGKVEGPPIDRSLNASAFNKVAGFRPPSWKVMLDELAMDIRQREGHS
ncbi:SDR family oxidoreductase [Phreatobacter aquaticus]|uniref:dTDP-4-dehydrorhamnose reductase n=1 Tax=Phreatobacter aquaticus TaxID=2570229 RepID=A0A4D7QM64_9HYPH|nr:SDR family oxidoreductase [Phreatobacter aquaticus]QCK87611.1 SDR family oxidoreductase [Phreatobacter aquaticus]